MAIWDSADLLARVKRYVNRPATDESITDPDYFAFLTEAENHWKPILATHYPGPMYVPPTKLSTSDGGVTYDFPGGITPIGNVELYRNPRGDPLHIGYFGDPTADAVVEGDRIRMVRGRARTFSDGPYARWVSPPGIIDAATQSTIEPAQNRILLIWDALERWAIRSGEKDPAFFQKKRRDAWSGDPAEPGDVGILGWLKRQVWNSGEAAIAGHGPVPWYRPADVN